MKRAERDREAKNQRGRERKAANGEDEVKEKKKGEIGSLKLRLGHVKEKKKRKEIKF